MNRNTVCLCGSTRFMEDFLRANVELTSRGMTVLSISMALPKNETHVDEEADKLKVMLDLVHLNKILRSDCIFVVGDGYVGFSTTREIAWAEMQGKPVFWQTDYPQKSLAYPSMMTNWQRAFEVISETVR